jgi:hypothetical protein
MLKLGINKTLITIGLLTFSALAFPVTLCHTCEISWVETESSTGILIIRPLDGSGSGPCINVPIRTKTGLSDRQKDQIYSGSLAAVMSGKKITANGDASDCNALISITIKNN